MRGFLVIALVLIGLEVITSSPLAGLSSAAAYPASLAASWMSAETPLIPARTSPAAAAPATPAPPLINPRLPRTSQGWGVPR